MTPAQFAHANWRIGVWRFMIAGRMVSDHPATRDHALLCASEAKALQSVLDTPPERYTAEQAAWFDWLARAEQLYREHDRVNDYAGYLALCNKAREQRDNALMMIREAA